MNLFCPPPRPPSPVLFWLAAWLALADIAALGLLACACRAALPGGGL